MEYLRKVDFAAFDATQERVNLKLLDRSSGATTVGINCVKTPPGSGSRPGTHVHVVDQIFYILKGRMSAEIAGELYEAEAGTLVIFPAGVPHRNWNAGPEVSVHLVINTALPEEDVPFATPA